MKNVELRCPGCGEIWFIEDLQSNTDRAKWWSLSDPDGVVYQFMDLMDFVNNHATFFDEADLVLKRGNSNWEICNAYSGLASLRPGMKSTALSWKGWTWHHHKK